MRRIAIVGKVTRYIASSAHRAGYEVYAIDGFLDEDLRAIAKKVSRLSRNWRRKLREMDPDAVVLASGMEFESLDEYTVLNNPPNVIKMLSDKKLVGSRLGRIGVRTPRIYGSNPKLPAIAKPRFGSGGYRNLLITREEELEKVPRDFVIQEFIQGTPMSISLISNGKDAVVVGASEILSGVKELGQQTPFGYCGNITPFTCPKSVFEVGRRICREFKLVGSNGIDFIISPDGREYVIDVNPRFHASIEPIELSTRINVFESHVRSFDGELPSQPDPCRYAAKFIVFAEHDGRVGELRGKWIADVPRAGKIVRKGEPIATSLSVGRSRESCVRSGMLRVRKIREALKLK